MNTLYYFLQKAPFSLFLMLLMVACFKRPEGQKTRFDMQPYYNIKGIINKQIQLLDSLNPEVKESGKINNKEETKVLQRDSAQWENALKLFKDADINKPVLQDSYTISDSSTTGNMQIKIYRAKKPSLPVRNLKVYYERSPDMPTTIKINFQEDTPLQYTKRDLELKFISENDRLRLKEYRVKGQQKMIFQDTISFFNHGTVKY